VFKTVILLAIIKDKEIMYKKEITLFEEGGGCEIGRWVWEMR
jgi:hypothetical protein